MNGNVMTRFGLQRLAACLLLTWAGVGHAADFGCTESAALLRYACSYDLRDDFFSSTAQCLDASVPDAACSGDAEAQYDDGSEECSEVLEARLDLCEALDNATHEPAFGALFTAEFVDPAQIGGAVAPNPYLPLVPGNRWEYEGTFFDDDGEAVTETITVTVTGDTKLIDGVACAVVTDVATEDDVVIESTDDWFAQDVDGNVWYCGEISRNFEVFDGDDPEEPELLDTEGSWKAGRERAKAGMLLPAAPEVGDVIRQEVSYGDAEDAIEIVSVTETESATGGACAGDCLMTRDFTPLDPEASEHKYYAPGIGLILEIDLESGDHVELIQFQGAGS